MSTVTERESSETTEQTTNKWVYLFDEGPGDDKTLLGGKGAGLCEMTQAGLPVPLDAKFFDATNILAVDVANLRTEQQLDVDFHASLPPRVRRRGFAR